MEPSRLGVCCLLLVGCSSFSAADDGTGGGGPVTPGNAACEGKHTLCLDFDHGPAPVPWNVANLGATATVVPSPEPAGSMSTSALKTHVDASTGSEFPLVSVSLPAPSKHVRCAATIDITEVSTTGGISVLRVMNPTATSLVELSIEPSYFKVDSSGGGHELPSLQTNRFAEIGIEVSTTGTGFITYSGPGGGQFSLPPSLADAEFTRADFGMAPNGAQTPWTAYFGALYCDVLP